MSLELARAGSQAEKTLLFRSDLLFIRWLGDTSEGVQVMSHKVSVPQQRAGRDTQEGAEEARVYLHRAMMKSYNRSERGEGMGGALPVLSHKAGI